MNRQVVENTLIKIGMPASLKGFRYITDAILLLEEMGNKRPKWCELYKEIGNINDTTVTGAERAMGNALTVMWREKRNVEMADYYIGHLNTKVSHALANLYKTIKSEEKNDVGEKRFIRVEEWFRKIFREEFKKAMEEMKSEKNNA